MPSPCPIFAEPKLPNCQSLHSQIQAASLSNGTRDATDAVALLPTPRLNAVLFDRAQYSRHPEYFLVRADPIHTNRQMIFGTLLKSPACPDPGRMGTRHLQGRCRSDLESSKLKGHWALATSSATEPFSISCLPPELESSSSIPFRFDKCVWSPALFVDGLGPPMR